MTTLAFIFVDCNKLINVNEIVLIEPVGVENKLVARIVLKNSMIIETEESIQSVLRQLSTYVVRDK